MKFRVLLSTLLLCFLAVSTTAIAQEVVIQELAELPLEVSESSGIENGPNGWFWTHNDSGNPAELFCVDTTGTIQRLVNVVGDPNQDWEEIAKDDDGNLYIGNFGNNSLNRTNLRIVKIPSIDTCTVEAHVTDTIRFTYPDQYDFPPVGTYGNFDMEALFHHQDSLHLFSKDRSDPSTGYTKHYRLPDHGGTYVAELVDSFEAGHFSFVFAVTAADISEDGDRIALLSSDRIWMFSDFIGTDYFGGNLSVLTLSVFSQKEAICFRNGFLYVTDERSFGLGGKMYRIDPNLFVPVSELASELLMEAVYKQDLSLEEIRLPQGRPVAWQLYQTSGQLVQEGISEERIAADEFRVSKGSYVIRIQDGKVGRSMLIQL